MQYLSNAVYHHCISNIVENRMRQILLTSLKFEVEMFTIGNIFATKLINNIKVVTGVGVCRLSKRGVHFV